MQSHKPFWNWNAIPITRAEHRTLLQSTALTLAPTLLLSTAIALLASSSLGLDPSYSIKTITVLIVGTWLIVLGIPGHHPFHFLGSANRITVIRAALVALLAGLIGETIDARLQAIATAIAAVAAAMDGLDGWLARRTRMSSDFGARFDMETDALMILVLSVLVWQIGKVDAWVLLSGAMRYTYVMIAALLPWMQQPLKPSYRRKTIAAVQTIALILALANFIPAWLSSIIAATALIALSYSFTTDVIWLMHRQKRKIAG